MRAILTYHSIDRTGLVISVTPEDFATHVAWAPPRGASHVGGGTVDFARGLQRGGHHLR